MNKAFGQFTARQAGTSNADQATVPTAKKTKTQVLNVLKPCTLALCAVYALYTHTQKIALVIWLLFA